MFSQAYIKKQTSYSIYNLIKNIFTNQLYDLFHSFKNTNILIPLV